MSKKKKEWKDLKPFEKVIGISIIAFIGLAIIMGVTGAFDEEKEPEKDVETVKEVNENEPIIENENLNEEEADEVLENNEENEVLNNNNNDEDDVTWDDLKENIIGKSDKDFKDASKAKPTKVRNDNTGNWRLTKISESIDIEDYALSYSDLHMKDGEVHFIVNFNYDTTTTLNKMNDLLYVDIHEYEKKEEHDASTLGNGMLLKSYIIYPDGDIQEIES